MDTNEMSESDVTAWKAIGLAFLYVVNYVIHNYNTVMGNVFITLSVIFLIYKMYKEYKKDKNNGSPENN